MGQFGGFRGRRCGSGSASGDFAAGRLQFAGAEDCKIPWKRLSKGIEVMPEYRRILLVVDLTEDSLPIGRRAQALATALGAEIDVLHVVEYVPVEPMGETLMPAVQIEDELLERAKQRLTALGAQLGIPATSCRVEAGNVKGEIIRIARERHTDLIVMGSRERHGLSILVNFTEDTVLHAAPCDVLAVRVGRPS